MLDRDELAARVLVALAGRDDVDATREDRYVPMAVMWADALLAALKPAATGVYRTEVAAADTMGDSIHTPAPVAYVPKVGDVVRFVGPRYGPDKDYEDRVLVRFDSNPPHNDRWDSRGVEGNGFASIFPAKDWWSYLRPATPAERKAAGLPDEAPVASSEAKRPTHVRITGPVGNAYATIGKVYEVLYFDPERDRLIIMGDGGFDWALSNKSGEGPAFPTWEPCPPPESKRDEAVRALVAYAECDKAYCKDSFDTWKALFAKHGWKGEDGTGFDFLISLRTRALILAREAGLTEGGSK